MRLSTMLDDVVNELRMNDGPFSIKDNGWTYAFIQMPYRKARLVYLSSYYGDDLNEDDEFKLFAIVQENGNIVVMGYVPFGGMKYSVSEYIANIEERINNVVPTCIATSDISDIKLTKEDKSECQERARKSLLEKRERLFDYPKFTLSKNDVFHILVGDTTIEEMEKKFLDDNNNEMKRIHACEHYIDKLIASGEVVQDWEERLVKALSLTQAVNVDVKFVSGNWTVVGKMNTEKLKKAVIDNDYFCDSIFTTSKDSWNVRDFIGVCTHDGLCAEKINSIMYRGKILYEKYAE